MRISWEDGTLWDGDAPVVRAEATPYLVGNGKLTLPCGQTLSGCWGTDGLNGPGTRTWPSGCTYRGGLVDGSMHGKGEMAWPSTVSDEAHTYVGALRRSVFHGRGVLRWSTTKLGGGRCRYSGGFARGRFSGKGTLELPDGSHFVGTFEGGRVEGVGTLRCGHVTSSGTWSAGRLHGAECSVEWKDSAAQPLASLTGRFERGLPREGRVVFAAADASAAVYIGALAVGADGRIRPHGAGSCEWPAHACRYAGEFQHGAAAGHGAAQWLGLREGAIAEGAAREYVGSWSSSGEAMDVTRATVGSGDAASPPPGETLPRLPAVPRIPDCSRGGSGANGAASRVALWSIVVDAPALPGAVDPALLAAIGRAEVPLNAPPVGSFDASSTAASAAALAEDIYAGGVDERGERHGRGVYVHRNPAKGVIFGEWRHGELKRVDTAQRAALVK